MNSIFKFGAYVSVLVWLMAFCQGLSAADGRRTEEIVADIALHNRQVSTLSCPASVGNGQISGPG